jgi:hypothetical protein
VAVTASSTFDNVRVTMERDVADLSLIDQIGARFNAALATGRYDELFLK